MRNRLICGCIRVYRSDIKEAVKNGAHAYTEIQEVTGAGTSCGNCRPLVEKVIKETLSEIEYNK
nr:(2Fe-2S)-binding protein [uncultured Mogibacterium sp.]